MLEPRKRTALDGTVWWCVFDTDTMYWSMVFMFKKYPTKFACQQAIMRYWKSVVEGIED